MSATAVGRLRSAARAVKRVLTRRGRGPESAEAPARDVPPQTPAAVAPAPSTPRVTRRETDIPLDVLNGMYTPPRTSSKSSFRSDGADHQLDQEFATGRADTGWNDEDRYTNKSGDPRIGTHRRTYEPAEARSETRE
ncbi:MAG TPA: hypothetical protein VFO89_11000 [Thermoanaerobaculia bacterium]|nr:hypothetical protein [Thermoanaerobaculia bacterium]